MKMALSISRKELEITFRVLRSNPLSIVGTTILLIVLLTGLAVVISGDKVLPHNPNKIDLENILAPPSTHHFLGTDHVGRDVFSRILASIPIDLEIASIVVTVSFLIGLTIGSISGYFAGRTDEFLMRTTDVFLAFPALLLVILISLALGTGFENLILALIIPWWPVYARIARSEALSVRENQYVEAAVAAGQNKLTIIRNHIIPNILSPLLVYASLDLGTVILYASVLSYLGLGAQPPQAEWGRMVWEGQTYLPTAWWVSITPGIAILITVLGFNLIGDALRDALDPRTRK